MSSLKEVVLEIGFLEYNNCCHLTLHRIRCVSHIIVPEMFFIKNKKMIYLIMYKLRAYTSIETILPGRKNKEKVVFSLRIVIAPRKYDILLQWYFMTK